MKYLLTEPGTLLHTFHTIQHAANYYQQGVLKITHRAHSLLYKYGFPPQEAYSLGLLNPTNRSNENLGFLSKANVLEKQQRLNPDSWCNVIKNKSIFYRYCQALQLPIPALYAVFFQGSSGWSNIIDVLVSKSDWCDFFENHLPNKFIIKPTLGSHGAEVSLYTRNGKGFINHKSQHFQSADLYDFLQQHAFYASFVIQEALLNHPALQKLSGTEGLQTARITTMVNPQGHCRIEHACFKSIVGQGIIDNHNNEQHCNLLSQVDLDTGTLVKTVVTSASHRERKAISHHPTTGMSLMNFQLPLWNSACELALEAAKYFLPIRTIGWDIALTASKPIIVEGNQHWDPPNLSASLE